MPFNVDFVFFIIQILWYFKINCGENITYGMVEKDSFVSVNESIILHCRIREWDETAHFSFKNNRLPSTNSTSTHIIYYKEHALYNDSGLYSCHSETTISSYARIKVKCIPPPFTKYSCFFFDLNFLECQFNLDNDCSPEHTLQTDYAVEWKNQNDIYQRQNLSSSTSNHKFLLNGARLFNNFTIKLSTIYPEPIKKFIVENILWINLSLAKPTQIKKPNVLKVTQNSLKLSWNHAKSERVEYEITYFTEFDSENENITKNIGSNSTYELSDLKPYTSYEIWIRSKLLHEGDPVGFWSDYFKWKTDKTLESSPRRPPEIIGVLYKRCIGDHMPRTCRRVCFFVDIPIQERNGIILYYNATYTANGSVISASSDRFQNFIQWEMDMDSDTLINISAHTKVGSSPTDSRFLPGLNNPSLIQSSPKVWGEENLEKTEIKIRWEVIEKIENIRLVYCKNSPDCRTGISYENINTSLTEYVWKKPDVSIKYFLALSFIRKNVPQMTEWMCIFGHYIPNKVFIKKVSPEANALHVEWIGSFCHSYRSAKIIKYKLHYCLRDKNPGLCKTIAVNNTEPKYSIVNLKPFSLYEIRLVAISEAGESEISETYEQKTLEGKPGTPPYDLRVGQITGNSVRISFKPPVQPNGIIRKYTVYVVADLGNDTFQTFHQNYTDILVTNLLGNANYSFRIRAENSSPSPSEYSEEISIVTLTRAASQLMASQIRYRWPKDKSNFLKVSWDEPISPNGKISEYRLTWNGTMTGNQTIHVPKRSANIVIPEDIRHVSLDLSIESVTYVKDNVFRSEPSQVIKINGYYIVLKKSNDLLAKTIGGTVGVGCLLIMYIIIRNRKVCKPFKIYQIFVRRGRQNSPVNELPDNNLSGMNTPQSDSSETYIQGYEDYGTRMLLEVRSTDSQIPNNSTAEPSHTYVDSPS